jgi:hypothetical protein
MCLADGTRKTNGEQSFADSMDPCCWVTKVLHIKMEGISVALYGESSLCQFACVLCKKELVKVLG